MAKPTQPEIELTQPQAQALAKADCTSCWGRGVLVYSNPVRHLVCGCTKRAARRTPPVIGAAVSSFLRAGT
jgi:hypothetical protein